MQTPPSTLSGLWLPLVTPFRDGALDEASLSRLVRHYAGQPIDGLILGATTGEGLTLDEEEIERLVTLSAAELAEAGSCHSSSAFPAATPVSWSRRWSARHRGRWTAT